MTDDGVRIFTAEPPRATVARVSLTNFEAPDVARAETSFALDLDIESEAQVPVQAEVMLSSDNVPLGNQKITLAPGMNRLKLPYRADHPGAYLMKAEIRVPPPLIAV